LDVLTCSSTKFKKKGSLKSVNLHILGKLISSQGPGTAAEFAFAIVFHYLGAERAEEIAKFYLYKEDVAAMCAAPEPVTINGSE
jgi:hypothetical protein